MDVTGDAAAAPRADDGYVDDLPFARQGRELVRPAAAALAAGAVSLLPVAVRAGNAYGLQAAWDGARGLSPAPGPVLTLEQVAASVAAAAFLLAGVFSCIWLVRVQRVAVRAELVDRHNPDSALWVMWALPFANLVLPAVRLARFDRVLHKTRHASWVVHAWAVCWVPTCSGALWQARLSRDDVSPLVPFVERQPGIVASAWWRLGAAVVGFALWAVIVVRLTRAARRVDAATVHHLAGGAHDLPAAP